MGLDSGVGYPFDIACLYVAVWSFIYAGSVFGSDCVGFGGVLSPGGMVLCYGSECGHCSGGAIWRFCSSHGYNNMEDSLLLTTGLPGCPYRLTSYNGPAISDMDPAFGLQLHHPRFLEFIGAPESACLLYRSPTFWVDRLGEEEAMAATVNLQRDAGIMLSNLQILSQFATSLHQMSSEMLSISMGRVVFPAEEIADLSPVPRVTRAAMYMAAMGLWRPETGSGDPGPVPASSCNACMNCRYFFLEGRLPPE